MTLAKNSSLSTSSASSDRGSSCRRSARKDMPKRAVSSFVLESVKFQAKSPLLLKKQEPTKKLLDNGDRDRMDHLQATDKRRRYMRRGSKCPSMLLGMANFKLLLQVDAADDDDDIDTKGNDDDKTNMILVRMQQQQQQARRLSLMSALKVSLESSCSVVGGASSSSKAIITRPAIQLLSRLPPQDCRMSAFKLLSSAMSEDDHHDDMITMMGI